jgi:hypothetical protein
MFKGSNRVILNEFTMRQVVQEWLDDRLGDDAPYVVGVSMRGGLFKPSLFEVEVRGESASAPILSLVKDQT